MAIGTLAITKTDIVAGQKVFASTELARIAQIEAWANDEVKAKAVDSSQVAASSGAIKAWVSFDGDDGSINGTGYNVTSVTRTVTGKYTIVWDTNFADTNYVIAGFCSQAITNGGVVTNSIDAPLSEGQAVIETRDLDKTLTDFNLVTIMAIGDQ